MRARKAGLISLLIACGLLLSGCWDIKDISDRAAIIAMGFDYLPGGKWRVTTSAALLAQGGSATYTGATHYGDGPNLTDAIEDLRTHLARSIYLGSTKVYVLGKGVLEAHSTEVLRMLLEHGEVDKTAFVLGTRATAQQLLEHPDKAMGLTAVRLLKEFETEVESRDGHIKEPLWKTIWGVLNPRDTLHLSVYDVFSKTGVTANGTALIYGGKLLTILNREESVTLRWLLKMPGRNVLPLDPPFEAYALKTTSVHTATRYDGRTRHIAVHISAAMEVYTAPSMELPAALLQRLSQAAAETMVHRLTALVVKMQAAGADGALWQNAATQAGYFDFDIRKTSFSVTVQARIAPHFAPTV